MNIVLEFNLLICIFLHIIYECGGFLLVLHIRDFILNIL